MNHIEHLVMTGAFSMRGTRFKTKFHEDLGTDLQHALEVLEKEGWEVAALSHDNAGTPIVILKMVAR